MIDTSIRVRRTFTQVEFDRFAELSGDDNPIHVDPAFSAATRFGRTVAHGMLLYSALWGLVRRSFPHAVQDSQSLMFPAPTYAGDPMRLEIDVLERSTDGALDLAVRVVAELDSTVTLEGRTRIRLAPGGTA